MWSLNTIFRIGLVDQATPFLLEEMTQQIEYGQPKA
jgi:hypothetical protein